MKITKKIERSINAACRRVCHGKRIVLIGQRQGSEPSGMNFLLWDEDADLNETLHADEAAEEEIGDKDGFVALDCYCYHPPEDEDDDRGDLGCNVYLLLREDTGEIVYESQDDLGHMAAIEEVMEQ